MEHFLTFSEAEVERYLNLVGVRVEWHDDYSTFEGNTGGIHYFDCRERVAISARRNRMMVFEKGRSETAGLYIGSR